MSLKDRLFLIGGLFFDEIGLSIQVLALLRVCHSILTGLCFIWQKSFSLLSLTQIKQTKGAKFGEVNLFC